MLKSRNAAKPLSSISLIPLWLSQVNRPATLPTRETEKDESAPPQKQGGHVTFCSGTLSHTSTRSHGGRSRPHLSLREGPEQPPQAGFFRGWTRRWTLHYSGDVC